MLNQNTDLYLIRSVLNHFSRLVDAIEAGRQQNVIQNDRLSCLEDEILYLRHRADRNEELEYWVNLYSQNGDALCNSQGVEDD